MGISEPQLLAISIETLAACTRRCWFCKYGLRRHQDEVRANEGAPPAEMPMDSIRRIIADLASLHYRNRVSWYRINEPLLDPRMPAILAETRRALPLCYQTLITNGDLLTPELCDELFEAGLDELSVSGYDHATIRRVGAFAGRFNVVLKDRTNSGFATNRAGNIPRLADRRLRGRCARPSTMLNVMTDGSACVCCCDLFGDHVLGNVLRDGIAAVWEGEGFRKYREALRSGERAIAPCDRCDYAGFGHKIRHTDPNIEPDAIG